LAQLYLLPACSVSKCPNTGKTALINYSTLGKVESVRILQGIVSLKKTRLSGVNPFVDWLPHQFWQQKTQAILRQYLHASDISQQQSLWYSYTSHS